MREEIPTVNRQLPLKSPGLRDRKIGVTSSLLNVPRMDSAECFSQSSDSSESVDDNEKPKKKMSVNFLSLFRYATGPELAWMAIGLLTSSLAGSMLPLEVILYGEFTSLLVSRKSEGQDYGDTLILHHFGGGRKLGDGATMEEKNGALIEDAVAFGLACAALTVAQFVVAIWGVDILNYTALRQITRIRKMYIESVLRQEMAWFDTNISDNFASGVTENLEKMKEGMGEKLSILVYMVMSFVSSVVVSLVYGWKLTLFVLCSTPIIIAFSAIGAKLLSRLTKRELNVYGTAGNVAEEVLNAIRTVLSFGGESKEVSRYTNLLTPAQEIGSKKGLISGISGGLTWFIIYVNYALSFWYGVSLILDDRTNPNPEYTPAVMIIVFFGVLAGAEQLGLTTPILETMASAKGAAHGIYQVIERRSQIDSLSEQGSQLSGIRDSIEFRDVYFHYPSRSDITVLHGLNLKINMGETVALVGASGCGKSTCLQLLQRLYDPVDGSVLIDGEPTHSLNIHWLRSQIGVVGQEPALFSMTIEDNIRYGNPGATTDEIEAAAKAANCHIFIKNLPEGYETMVGERGAQLSGGQKQRIAIARALVSNPKILLLDEATSALDLQSEAKVQKALEQAAKGRTTIIVAHRLSTIQHADRIVYLQNGQVKETGTHEELMKLEGHYFNLVSAEQPKESRSKLKAAKAKTLKRPVKIIVDKEVSDDDDDDDDLSVESEDAKSTIADNVPDSVKNVSTWRILKYNKQEWHILTVATLSAFLIGASFPAFAIIFGEFYGLLSDDDDKYVRQEIVTYSIWFVVVGVVTGLGTFLQIYLYNRAGAALTKRLRVATFEAMLKQEVAWYDRKANSVGALTARLAGDCSSVQGATGTRIGAVMQAFATLTLGISLSFYYSWKMTLVSLVSVPIVLGATVLEGRVMDEESEHEKTATEASTKIASEAIMNIRTVAGLCAERTVLNYYNNAISDAVKAAKSGLRFRGIVFSLGQTIPFGGYALSLYYGGVLVAQDEVHFKNVIKVSEALIFGAWMIGQALAFAPNFRLALLSAARIFRLLDRQPQVVSPTDAKPLTDFDAKGDVSYQAVEFSYPTRPEVPVLQSLYLDVTAGKTIALVGQSGCGKSTCIQLLQRLYDADAGKITLDELQINRDYALPKLRSQLGIVSQEPVLFDKTIADNIAYGDNSRAVTMEEIMKAAQEANIHKFIMSLPQGYGTSLGTKGTQLSGGQKQRIAIARALVRNPRVLLLDEATSALDMESEKVVSDALETARTGRTCIIIAHRLASVRHADYIAVIVDGKVAEFGPPDELLETAGLYSQLYALQNRA